MTSRLILGLVVITLTGLNNPARGQLSSGGLVSMPSARAQGLERMWATAVEVDGGRDTVVGMHVHVSHDPKRERKIVYVEFDPAPLRELFAKPTTNAATRRQISSLLKKTVYTDADPNFDDDSIVRDRIMKPIGKEGAVQRANEHVNALKPFKVEAKTREYNVPEITVYVASQRGFVQAIDGQTGATRWTNRVGNAAFPTRGPGANDDYVAVVNGRTLYVLNQSDGGLAWSKNSTYVPSAAPALSDELAFMLTTRGVIEAFQLDDPKRPTWTYQSRGHAFTRPICTQRSVIWPTDRGHLYVGDANEGGIKYRLEARESIEAAATAAGGKVFATSSDGYVYCVEENGGAILWRYSAGEPIHESAIPVGENVYVIGASGGMHSLAIADGMEQWFAPGIRRFVAASDTRVYAQDSSGYLVILNPQSGGRIGHIPTTGVDLVYENYQTDRIYLGSRTGLIMSLRESQLLWPLEHHRDEATVKVSRPQVVQEGLDDAPADEPRRPMADPFGAADDPFGAKPADDAPAPGPADDPFGNPFD